MTETVAPEFADFIRAERQASRLPQAATRTRTSSGCSGTGATSVTSSRSKAG